jgi:hypothetical protein
MQILILRGHFYVFILALFTHFLANAHGTAQKTRRIIFFFLSVYSINSENL